MSKKDKKQTKPSSMDDLEKPVNTEVTGDDSFDDDFDLNDDELNMSFLDELEEMGTDFSNNEALLNNRKDKKIAELEAKLLEKDEKITELEDINSRLKDNIKSSKRAAERLQEEFNTKSARKMEKFIKERFIPAIDDLENALTYITSEKDLDGIKGVLQNLYNSLAAVNIEKIDAEGKKFNPEIHNALTLQEDKSKDDNTVLFVQRTGYQNTETGALLRASDVVVNKHK